MFWNFTNLETRQCKIHWLRNFKIARPRHRRNLHLLLLLFSPQRGRRLPGNSLLVQRVLLRQCIPPLLAFRPSMTQIINICWTELCFRVPSKLKLLKLFLIHLTIEGSINSEVLVLEGWGLNLVDKREPRHYCLLSNKWFSWCAGVIFDELLGLCLACWHWLWRHIRIYSKVYAVWLLTSAVFVILYLNLLIIMDFIFLFLILFIEYFDWIYISFIEKFLAIGIWGQYFWRFMSYRVGIILLWQWAYPRWRLKPLVRGQLLLLPLHILKKRCVAGFTNLGAIDHGCP